MLELYTNKKELELARKLKVGDKVKIKSKEELIDLQHRLASLTNTMLKYAGEELYIERNSGDIGYGEPYFTLKGNDYIWSVRLFDFGKEKDIKKYSLE